MIHSFLLIGQSNMAGRGNIGDVPAISDQRLLMQRNGRWYPLAEPVNYDRPFAGVNLCTSFGLGYVGEHPEDSAAMIPCADGGSTLDMWKKGEALYEYAVFCAKLALRNSELKAILWHQGEADCLPELSATYQERFETMIFSMQKDIGVSAPVLVGGLGDYLAQNQHDEKLHRYQDVNRQLLACAAENATIYYVSARGLTPKPDYLHFSAKALREFGERYYHAFAEQRSLLDEEFPEETEQVEQNDRSALILELERLKKEYDSGRLTSKTFEQAKEDVITRM